MAYWLSRDYQLYAPYDLWTKRPKWYKHEYKNGKMDTKQPIDSYEVTSFEKVSGLHLKPGEIVKIVSFEIKVERVQEKK